MNFQKRLLGLIGFVTSLAVFGGGARIW